MVGNQPEKVPVETHDRDPYAAPHAPKSRSGPILRFAIIGGLLVAGAVGFMNLPRGGESIVPTEETTLAQNDMNAGYVASQANEFVDPPAIPEPAPAAAPAPSQRSAPSEPVVEELPAPSTTTEPTAPAATPLPPG